MEAVHRKKLVHMHGQRFVRIVMADRLRKAGFVSLDGEDIHWCRVIDSSIIQMVYFYVQETTLPAAPMIGYASHPIFLIPVFPRSFYIYGITAGVEVFHPGRPLMKLGVPTRMAYDNDIFVACPNDDYCGEDILIEIIEILDCVRTAADCYQMHKNLYLHRMKHYPKDRPYKSASTEFMAEALYWNDEEILPFCEMRVNEWISLLEINQNNRKLAEFEKKQMTELIKLRSALTDGERDAYLRYLENNEQITIQMLKHRAGITVKK